VVDHVYVTEGLIEALLGFARERDPGSVTIGLSVAPAGELDPPVDVQPGTPVFTHFYMPGEDSVSAVFGIDLGTPRTQGRFVSHPEGDPELSRTDDLHEVVFVATPPWTPETVRAYDRSGQRVTATVLDAAPPAESVS
jgi:proteasome lid subunit RPN8/RPN11